MRVLMLVFVIVLLTSVCFADIINIPDDFETIQAGIDASQDGDTVLVAQGEYAENINFTGKAIKVIGDSVSRDDYVIDGGGNGSVVTFSSGEGDESQISGFEIINGTADAGGGIFISGSSPRLSNLGIRSNSADNGGGGIACLDGAQPNLTEVRFLDNVSGTVGGGFYCVGNSSPVLTDCFFYSNRADISGGQVACWGAEITMSHVRVCGERNYVHQMGGGIYITRGVATLDHIMLESCSAELGGGFSIWNSTVDMNWIHVGYNEASTGAGLYVDNSVLSINHLTCVSNSAADGWAGGMFNNDVELTLLNSLFWSNEAGNVPQMVLHGGSYDITYCDVEDGMNGVDHDEGELIWENIISEDPCFFSVGEGDFNLLEDSPCIDAGDPESEPDPDGTRADMGAFYFPQRDIDVSPLEVQFPPIAWNVIDSLSVVITNTGWTDLTIDSIGGCLTMSCIWMNEENRDEWEPIVIEPLGEVRLWIYYHPQVGAVRDRTFWIYSDDPDEPEVTVHAEGDVIDEVDDADAIPYLFHLSPPYPNPFNSSATINFTLPAQSAITLSIYNTRGQMVDMLLDQVMPAGKHSVVWDAGRFSTGVYLVEIKDKVGNASETGKVVLVR